MNRSCEMELVNWFPAGCSGVFFLFFLLFFVMVWILRRVVLLKSSTSVTTTKGRYLWHLCFESAGETQLFILSNLLWMLFAMITNDCCFLVFTRVV